MDNTKKDGADNGSVVEIDPIAAANERLSKVEAERDNYKKVALKRLGKLPGDADFLEGADPKTGLTVEEQVTKALLDNEYKRVTGEKDDLIKKQSKELSELRLALKNRPDSVSIAGGSSSEGLSVKDNVLTDAQIASLTANAIRLKADPEKFIERFKQNLAKR